MRNETQRFFGEQGDRTTELYGQLQRLEFQVGAFARSIESVILQTLNASLTKSAVRGDLQQFVWSMVMGYNQLRNVSTDSALESYLRLTFELLDIGIQMKKT